MSRRHPGYILREYFRLRAELSAPPSPMGTMLARARRYGRQPHHEGALKVHEAPSGTHGAAHVRLAEFARLVGSLSPEEEEIAALRHWHPADGHEVYTRNVSADDVRPEPVGEYPNPPSLLMTVAGEEYVGAATEHKQDGTGEAVERRAVVRGVRVRLTSYETIARLTGASQKRIKALLRDVSERVREKLRRELAKGGDDGEE